MPKVYIQNIQTGLHKKKRQKKYSVFINVTLLVNSTFIFSAVTLTKVNSNNTSRKLKKEYCIIDSIQQLNITRKFSLCNYVLASNNWLLLAINWFIDKKTSILSIQLGIAFQVISNSINIVISKALQQLKIFIAFKTLQIR